MKIRYDYKNADGMGDDEAAWKSVLDLFCSNESPTVVSIVSQLVRLMISEIEGTHNFLIRAQELYCRLQPAGEHSNPDIFNGLILTGLPEQYEPPIVRDSFNPSGDNTDLRQRLLNYSIGKEQRLEQSASHDPILLKSFARMTRNKKAEKMVKE